VEWQRGRTTSRYCTEQRYVPAEILKKKQDDDDLRRLSKKMKNERNKTKKGRNYYLLKSARVGAFAAVGLFFANEVAQLRRITVGRESGSASSSATQPMIRHHGQQQRIEPQEEKAVAPRTISSKEFQKRKRRELEGFLKRKKDKELSAAVASSGGDGKGKNGMGETNTTTIASGVASSRRRQLPTFVLHVGMPKTGTTFLQCSLCARAETTEPTLLRDNYVFLGTCPYNTCLMEQLPPQYLKHRRSSFVKLGMSRDSILNKYGPVVHFRNESEPLMRADLARSVLAAKFVDRVEQLRSERRNVLVIFEGCENFMDKQIQALYRFLAPGKLWNVRVVVAYRPLFDWLPSKYNSLRKPGRSKTHNQWPGLHLKHHPDLVGEPILPFDVRERDDFSKLVDYVRDHGQHPAETTYSNYVMHFGADLVDVVPIHQLPNVTNAARGTEPDPLMHYLFCHVITNAPNSCEAVRSGQIGNAAKNTAPATSGSNSSSTVAPAAPVSTNPTVSLNYDMLTTTAFELGLVPRDTKRKRSKIRAKVSTRQERVLNLTSHDFPLACLPNETMSWLEDLSWRLERSFFFGDSGGIVRRNDTAGANLEDWEANHRAGFAHSRDTKHAFCWIDANRTLQEDYRGWRSFFASVPWKENSTKRTTRRRRGNSNRGDDNDMQEGADDDNLDDDDWIMNTRDAGNAEEQ